MGKLKFWVAELLKEDNDNEKKALDRFERTIHPILDRLYC